MLFVSCLLFLIGAYGALVNRSRSSSMGGLVISAEAVVVGVSLRESEAALAVMAAVALSLCAFLVYLGLLWREERRADTP